MGKKDNTDRRLREIERWIEKDGSGFMTSMAAKYKDLTRHVVTLDKRIKTLEAVVKRMAK